MEEVGAVDGARNRYFMSSDGLWCPATAGTHLAPRYQVILGTQR